MTALDELVRQRSAGELPDETRILYVSPLKALSNDVHMNLEIPLAGIAELARAEGIPLARDSSRGAHRRHSAWPSGADDAGNAPHILVTTPESLFILLTAEQVARDAALGAHADRG